MKLKRLPVFAPTRLRRRSFSDRAIPVSPSAHDIEALEGEAWRIHLAVTGGAAGVVPMLFELLPNRHGTPNVRFHGPDWRGRWNVDAQYPFHDPLASQHRRGRGAIRRDFQHAGLGQES